MTRMARSFASAALIGAVLIGAPALAQRDPAYAAARAAGTVGEKPDGYLAVVTPGNATLQALVDDINIRRREEYTRQAAATGSTVEQFAFTTGCNLILRTVPGEKYMTPSGAWQTRTAAAPIRDARCV